MLCSLKINFFDFVWFRGAGPQSLFMFILFCQALWSPHSRKKAVHICASAWQNPQIDVCAQQSLRSAWASIQSDQSSLPSWRKLGSLGTPWALSEDWSDWADAQADLSLCWAHRSICWFCHAAAHLWFHAFCSSTWYRRRAAIFDCSRPWRCFHLFLATGRTNTPHET